MVVSALLCSFKMPCAQMLLSKVPRSCDVVLASFLPLARAQIKEKRRDERCRMRAVAERVMFYLMLTSHEYMTWLCFGIVERTTYSTSIGYVSYLYTPKIESSPCSLAAIFRIAAWWQRGVRWWWLDVAATFRNMLWSWLLLLLQIGICFMPTNCSVAMQTWVSWSEWSALVETRAHLNTVVFTRKTQ